MSSGNLLMRAENYVIFKYCVNNFFCVCRIQHPHPEVCKFQKVIRICLEFSLYQNLSCIKFISVFKFFKKNSLTTILPVFD